MEEQKNVQEVEVETTAASDEVAENNNDNVVEKSFTQDEVNAIVKERLAKAQKGIPSKEELAAYNEWKESQKTQQDKYDELVQKSADKDNEINDLKKENLVLKSGITDKDDVEFIIYKVGKMEGDFETNLEEYLAENPKYTKKQEKATGVETKQPSAEKESGVDAILKAKHPELFS